MNWIALLAMQTPGLPEIPENVSVTEYLLILGALAGIGTAVWGIKRLLVRSESADERHEETVSKMHETHHGTMLKVADKMERIADKHDEGLSENTAALRELHDTGTFMVEALGKFPQCKYEDKGDN